MNEQWKAVRDYEGLYEVSNMGRVKGIDRISANGRHLKGKVLSPKHTKYGYLQVNLCKNNKLKYFSIHRLVAMAFVPGFKDSLVVNHIDEDKTNNRFNNLEWITNKENLNYGTRIRRITEKHKKVIYSISPDGKLLKFDSQTEASIALGINRSNIWRMINGNQKTCKGYKFYEKMPEIKDSKQLGVKQ